MDELDQCRQDIDRVDRVIAALLHERERLARIFQAIVEETRRRRARVADGGGR